MWKNFVKTYFDFTKKERIGIITILLLVVFFSGLPYFYNLVIPTHSYSSSGFEKEIAALHLKKQDSSDLRKKFFDEKNYQNYYEPSQKNYTAKQQWKGELFEFDPNTLNQSGWKKLGVNDKTIAIIQNYLSKGGKFYKAEDIDKIWGLHDDEVERLKPFIKIDESNFKYKSGSLRINKTVFEKPKNLLTPVDINLADTSTFIALPGIGSKLSNRIITFREKLGGFYKVEQVGETFGLADSVFQKIKPRLIIGNATVNKININIASLDELKAHPYIRYAMANSIIQYRKQHGNFSTIAEIKKIFLITEEMYNKAAPYLTVN